jgi:cation diffusion facilitator family transporter
MNKPNKVMGIMFISNFFLATLQIIVGFIGKSSAVIADGVHTFSDLVTDLVAIIGNIMSLKPADSKHPDGHGKIEYLTSIAIGITILILGFLLITDSFSNELVVPNILVVIVTIITIVSKLILSKYLLNKGVEYKNSILIASGKESFVDVISSLVVLISVILMQFSNEIPFLLYADKIGAILVSLFILKTGFNIISENVSYIIGEQETDSKYIGKVKELILKHDKVESIVTLNVLKYGPYYKLEADITMNGNLNLKTVHETVDLIENELKIKHKVNRITIHVSPKND